MPVQWLEQCAESEEGATALNVDAERGGSREQPSATHDGKQSPSTAKTSTPFLEAGATDNVLLEMRSNLERVLEADECLLPWSQERDAGAPLTLKSLLEAGPSNSSSDDAERSASLSSYGSRASDGLRSVGSGSTSPSGPTRRRSILKEGRLSSSGSDGRPGRSRSIQWSTTLAESNEGRVSRYDVAPEDVTAAAQSASTRPSLMAGWRAKVLSQTPPQTGCAKDSVFGDNESTMLDRDSDGLNFFEHHDGGDKDSLLFGVGSLQRLRATSLLCNNSSSSNNASSNSACVLGKPGASRPANVLLGTKNWSTDTSEMSNIASPSALRTACPNPADDAFSVPSPSPSQGPHHSLKQQTHSNSTLAGVAPAIAPLNGIHAGLDSNSAHSMEIVSDSPRVRPGLRPPERLSLLLQLPDAGPPCAPTAVNGRVASPPAVHSSLKPPSRLHLLKQVVPQPCSPPPAPGADAAAAAAVQPPSNPAPPAVHSMKPPSRLHLLAKAVLQPPPTPTPAELFPEHSGLRPPSRLHLLAQTSPAPAPAAQPNLGLHQHLGALSLADAPPRGVNPNHVAVASTPPSLKIHMRPADSPDAVPFTPPLHPEQHGMRPPARLHLLTQAVPCVPDVLPPGAHPQAPASAAPARLHQLTHAAPARGFPAAVDSLPASMDGSAALRMQDAGAPAQISTLV